MCESGLLRIVFVVTGSGTILFVMRVELVRDKITLVWSMLSAVSVLFIFGFEITEMFFCLGWKPVTWFIFFSIFSSVTIDLIERNSSIVWSFGPFAGFSPVIKSARFFKTEKNSLLIWSRIGTLGWKFWDLTKKRNSSSSLSWAEIFSKHVLSKVFQMSWFLYLRTFLRNRDWFLFWSFLTVSRTVSCDRKVAWKAFIRTTSLKSQWYGSWTLLI